MFAFLEDEVAAEVFLADVGVVGEVLGGALLEDRAFVEEIGAVGDMEGLADVVVGDKDADVAFLEFEDDVLDVLHSDGVDAGEGFVEEKEHGVVGERTCDFGATTFAAGELDALALTDVAEVELLYQGVEFLAALFLVEILAELEDGHDIVLDGHVAEDGSFLREVADPHLRAFVHGVLGEFNGFTRLAAIGFRCKIDFPAVGFDDADDHVEGGGLAGAVGTQEAYYLALADFDGGTFDDGAGAVFLDDVVGVETHGLRFERF